MSRRALLELREQLTPADHQTHRRYTFDVPAECLRLRFHVRYTPKWVDEAGAPNLLTISLDDAAGAYRGAGHRHAEDQLLTLGIAEASPGLVAGPLPPGSWALTLSAHTLVSAQCELSIQIGAETASN